MTIFNDADIPMNQRGLAVARGGRGSDLIYDWNLRSLNGPVAASLPEVADETLRDGLQSPSVRDPSVGEKIELLHLMVRLGIQCAAIGMPAANERQFAHTLRLAQEVARHKLPISVYCAARTLRQDIAPVIEISQRAGIPIEVATFIGSSPIRAYAEGWIVDDLQRYTAQAVSFATAHGLPVMYVTEDTTRSHPETLKRLYETAIEAGARRLCISDTVGHALPAGARSIVHFVRTIAGQGDIAIDWHGHRDRGFELANAFAAWEAGANRCHGTALGVGERCGNVPIELLLVNLELLGKASRDLTGLTDYVDAAARALGVVVPPDQAVVGSNAFLTATGVHAAAVVKAEALGQTWVADNVYSAVPARLVGKRQDIVIGPMSGGYNVRYYLAQRGVRCNERLEATILGAAKRARTILTEAEVLSLVEQHRTTEAPALHR